MGPSHPIPSLEAAPQAVAQAPGEPVDLQPQRVRAQPLLTRELRAVPDARAALPLVVSEQERPIGRLHPLETPVEALLLAPVVTRRLGRGSVPGVGQGKGSRAPEGLAR